MKDILKDTLPVAAGYIVLGAAFGMYAHSAGIPAILTILTSFIVYAGSMQFVLVDLIANKASLLTTALTTLLVNGRHLFYGLTMVERYRNVECKPYTIFALTDETFSLVCNKEGEGFDRYAFLVSVFNQAYWIIGTIIGTTVSNAIPVSFEGVEFSMTALFVTVFVEQWLSTKDHFPALCGLGIAAICLFIFGKDTFLIPTMILILVVLLARKKVASC